MKLPNYAAPLFYPKRYKVLYGGRGSAKSETIARYIVIRASTECLRILCAREFQNSINESVYKLLEEVIEKEGLSHAFTIKKDKIISVTGSEIMFKGVRNNITSVKSMQSIDICWLEEAQTVSKTSWDVLIPTLRRDGSEFLVSFNPNDHEDPTYAMFVNKETNEPLQRDDAIIIKANYTDNPWFPSVLEQERTYLYSVDPELADHVWGGMCRTVSDAQIFKGKFVVKDFEINPNWDGPYFGGDFGFSNDPSTLVKLYIDRHEKKLYVAEEAWGLGVELDHYKEFYSEVSESKSYLIKGDSSRPETINHITKKGYYIEGAEKWENSVEEGITFLRSFKEIVIHHKCKHTKDEFKYYSYKVDKLTNEVTRVIVDKHNHCIDAIRYALVELIKIGGVGILYGED